MGRSKAGRVRRFRLLGIALARLELPLGTTDHGASRAQDLDTLLPEAQPITKDTNHAEPEIEGSDQTLASPAGGRTSADSSGSDSTPRCQFHGHGRGAGGRGVDSPTT